MTDSIKYFLLQEGEYDMNKAIDLLEDELDSLREKIISTKTHINNKAWKSTKEYNDASETGKLEIEEICKRALLEKENYFKELQGELREAVRVLRNHRESIGR